MDSTRSSTPVTEPSAAESLNDTRQLLSSPPQTAGSSSAFRESAAEGAVQQRKKISLRNRAATLMEPYKESRDHPQQVWQSLRAVILASYLNILLVCIPISWALHFALPEQQTLIFVCALSSSFFRSSFSVQPNSLIPGHHTSCQADSHLLRMNCRCESGKRSRGNTVELIVSIIALIKCEIDIVQSSLIGSILSNLLLVLGMCFFAGGLKFSEQGFGLIAAQMNSTLLTISVIAVLLPGAFMMVQEGNPDFDKTTTDHLILRMSHGVAIILLFIYASYLFFQLSSHKGLYKDDSEEILESKRYAQNPFKIKGFRKGKRAVAAPQYTETPRAASPISYSQAAGITQAIQPASEAELGQAVSEEEEMEQPQMSVPVSIGLLGVVTVLVAVTAEFLVDSINGLTDTGHISKEFVGVILLPIVGNAAEHVTAVLVSVEDKLTLSLGVAVGSSIQIALFVIPFMITLGWIIGKPLTLLFDPLQSIVLFFQVLLTVNYVVQDGKSNWLEGMILMCLYLILGVTFWFYPGVPPPLTC
ncbi:calcium proton exchanger [Chiua virens]|nr:calcium proton exchanger [Chiua virens]